MQQYAVSVKGVTPYMQHRMDDAKLANWEKLRKFIIERDDIAQADAERAEFHCYRNAKGENYIPGDHFRLAFINAGSFSKAKVGNARKSMKNIVAAMFMVEPEEIIIPHYDAIDKRSAVNKNIKGRVIVLRPKWAHWEAEFTLKVDNDTITQEQVKEIICNAGQYIGIGSYRPMNNGYFGRFELVSLLKSTTQSTESGNLNTK